MYVAKTKPTTSCLQLGPASTARLFPEDKYWFSRGHLFRRSDANTINGQASTMFYINTAPQWGLLNSGNWNVRIIRLKIFHTAF